MGYFVSYAIHRPYPIVTHPSGANTAPLNYQHISAIGWRLANGSPAICLTPPINFGAKPHDFVTPIKGIPTLKLIHSVTASGSAADLFVLALACFSAASMATVQPC